MKTKYIDLIQQTYDWPQEEFKLDNDLELMFHDIYLMDIIKKYGTPLKISYLPIISKQIEKAKMLFKVAMAKANYEGTYTYCYCTKSSHFSFVLEEALKNDIHIETSSAYDINIIEKLEEKGLFDKDKYIVCNGYKLPAYIANIARLIENGYKNVIPVLDNVNEIEELSQSVTKKTKIGIRIASEEAPKFDFYTSRLGIGYKDIVSFYSDKVKKYKNFELKMLHFFINTGITDTAYYWSELAKCVRVYCDLKKVCPTLDTLNIGGGLPIKTSLAYQYDYEYMIEEIVAQIKRFCVEADVKEPNIVTEFGTFTVGSSGAAIYKVIDQKKQNDREKWNMIDSSFMTTLPDAWAINKRFIMLAINNWEEEYERVFLGGLTCDSDDFYNSEQNSNAIFLPKIEKNRPQYIGFFHTGAYQETIGGYGGIQHCLTPAPKHVIIYKNEHDEVKTKLFSKEQDYKSMLDILGY
ncbi:MAG: arginine decarboxylase [Chitinophagales bacterium]|jgi:arginine decarboxylase|nr:arginine decarboxylase [Chitinophagales bacterium]